MDIQAFQHLLGLLSQLTAKQKSTLRRALYEPHRQDAVDDVLLDLQACPHCAASVARLSPWGWSRGLRRYRCRACRYTCNALSSSALAHLRKPTAGTTMPGP